MKLADSIYVGRFGLLKREAKQFAAMMRVVGAKHVRVFGERGLWRARALMTVHQLCEFISVEARHVLAEERRAADKR